MKGVLCSMKKRTAILTTLLGGMAGAAVTGKIAAKEVQNKGEKIIKFKGYYNMLNQWLALKQEGKSLAEYFVTNGYKEIAIYGMGEMGNRLYDELKDTEIQVKYAIDKNAASTYSELDVKEIDDELTEVDVVVVTATFAFDEIKEKFSGKVDMPIVSLEDVVYSV